MDIVKMSTPEKICVINQAAGLGDVLWEQKIAHHFNSLGYRVIWPIVEPYDMIGDYIKSDWCEFVKLGVDDYPFKNIWDDKTSKIDFPVEWPGGHLYLPLGTINRYWENKPLMHTKYSILGLDWSDWKDYINYVPNEEKTEQLRKIVGIPESEYNFVNSVYGSPNSGLMSVQMKVSSKLPVVQLKLVDGFNIFDWIPIILEAKEVHTVDTALCFLVEKYSENQKLCMYGRFPGVFYHIEGIFNKWEMFENTGNVHEVKM
jgi:hypothetical protein